MLNPSTADALIDDPTIRRCMGFVQSWGHSVLCVRNLFSFRATDPAALRRAADPVGPQGDANIMAALTADLVVAAWGAGGGLLGRDRKVMALLAAKDLYCLKKTKGGHPQHPLYIKASQEPVLYRKAQEPTP
jgi:hypothetical protein